VRSMLDPRVDVV